MGETNGRRTFLLAAGATAVLGLGAAAATLGVPGTPWRGFLAPAATVADGLPPVFTGKTEGVAINGYDTVAYFTEAAAREGSPEHVYRWRGVEWRFVSDANRTAFAADPERYAPQYRGYCAFAMARGNAVRTEPEAWSVVDGKLYLNYDLPIRERWLGEANDFIAAADGHWRKLAE